MRKDKQIINSIKKNIGIYINNTNEFNNILNNDCIISGEFLLKHINNVNTHNNINIIDIFCTIYEYSKLKLLLINNNFTISEYYTENNENKKINHNLFTHDYNVTRHKFVKDVLKNKLIFNITITDHPINYINLFYKLKIEKNYYNGVLLIMSHPKNVILKYEKCYINKFEYINNTNINSYISYGYKFKLVNLLNSTEITIFNYKKYNKKKLIKLFINYIKYNL